VKVDDQVVFGTSAAAVDWRTAGQRTPTKGADVAGVYHSGRPVEPPEGVESPEQLAMQPIPYAGCLPVRSRRHAVTPEPADLPRQHSPRYARHEHEEDGRERDAVVDTRTPNPQRYTCR
jgi:hypothetical protein